MRGATRRWRASRHQAIGALARSDSTARSRATPGDVPDIERITTRIALLSARPRDLASLRDGLQQLRRLRAQWSPAARRGCALLATIHYASGHA